MNKDKIPSQLKILVFGFFVALLGAIFGFLGWHLNLFVLVLLGYLFCLTGIILGGIGILSGWLYIIFGKRSKEKKQRKIGDAH